MKKTRNNCREMKEGMNSVAVSRLQLIEMRKLKGGRIMKISELVVVVVVVVEASRRSKMKEIFRLE